MMSMPGSTQRSTSSGAHRRAAISASIDWGVIQPSRLKRWSVRLPLLSVTTIGHNAQGMMDGANVPVAQTGTDDAAKLGSPPGWRARRRRGARP